MTTLKIKDNSTVNKDEFSEVNSVTNKIADKTLVQLEKEGVFVFPELVKEANDITKDQMILQSVNENYRTSNVMGFLGYGKDRLVIESRFSREDEDFFFQYLLERVLNFPNILDLNTDANQENRLFSLLLFLFPYYLKVAMRKGEFKTYVHNKYNDGNVKGIIDIGRHIQKNIPFTGKVAYNQREFSYDNSLMEIIRHTIEYIKKKPYGNNLLRKVKDEVAAIVSITEHYEYYDRQKVVIENKKNPVRHAYYHEYRALQKLCIMILQHDKHQIGSGVRQIHGILFDGAWLWEEYINQLIGDVFYHPMNKGGKGAQRLFSTDENSKVGLIYPDFISRDDRNRIIADAKYKPIGNIGNRDYLQILAYMFRFDAKKGYYLYPEQGEIDKLTLMMNSGSTYEGNVKKRDDILIIKCGLRIPKNADSYESFVKKIQISEKVFLSSITS
ncbi:MAG TPA: hypothetical protein VGC17_01325 [Lactovum miscens]|uniref:5-methylcytosine restriction system specificity protein McrC n=1 Tax=Lactovum miscens TaxID=190387 RepID=UPI002EDAE1C0